MYRRIRQILIKEFLQLRRDRWARFRLLVPPIIQMLLFGYAATFEVFGVSTAVLDLDSSQESRALIAEFANSARFKVVKVATTQQEVEDAVERSTANLAIVVHAGFAQLLRKGQTAPLQILVDGTNSNTALIALGYVDQIASSFGQDYAADFAARSGRLVRRPAVQVILEERSWYNESLNSRWFFVPGVIGTLTLVITVNLTAFAIVREREVGTLEQILVSPIRPVEFIIGKTLPFFVIGLLEVSIVAGVGILWFDIPFVGNPFVMFLGTCLFLFSTLAIGLLISTLCSTQQQAFASNFFVLNPLFTLSGFSFPIASMSPTLQWLTYINPLRYYLVIIRGTFLKGIGLSVLWPDMLALAGLGVGLLTVAVLRFRKSLD